MAKRKRLTPAQPDYLADYPADPGPGHAASAGPGPEPAQRPAQKPGQGALAGSAPFQRAPIAHVASDAATHAALSAVTAELQQARAEGRLIQAVPLHAIDVTYLVRDRLMAEEDDLAPLVDSLRIRGQQTPIEVVALADGRYGLISGWRRLTALHRLHDQTGDPRFGTVLAILRRPTDAAEAYLAMVEENEIRVGLSYYERARIVVKAVEGGVFPSARAGLQGLFGTASRAKRSKIGSFMAIVIALDGALRFPTALGERAGLVLARALEDDPAIGKDLVRQLMQVAPQSPEAELAVLVPEKNMTYPVGAGARRPARSAASAAIEEPLPGVFVQISQGSLPPRLTLSGPGIDAAFHDRLIDWLRTQG